jgi:hypothetical protein
VQHHQHVGIVCRDTPANAFAVRVDHDHCDRQTPGLIGMPMKQLSIGVGIHAHAKQYSAAGDHSDRQREAQPLRLARIQQSAEQLDEPLVHVALPIGARPLANCPI